MILSIPRSILNIICGLRTIILRIYLVKLEENGVKYTGFVLASTSLRSEVQISFGLRRTYKQYSSSRKGESNLFLLVFLALNGQKFRLYD